jgi:hypothetical protein
LDGLKLVLLLPACPCRLVLALMLLCYGVREAAHRSREREKLYRQALEDDNAMLQQEHSWLQQQVQWQVQKLNGGSSAATVLVYNPAATAAAGAATPAAGTAVVAAPAVAAAVTGQLALLAVQQQQLAAVVSAAAGSGSGVQLEAATPYMLAKGEQQQQQQKQKQKQQQAAMPMQKPLQPAADSLPTPAEQQTELLEKGVGEAAEALLRKLAAICDASLPAAAAADCVADVASTPAGSSKLPVIETEAPVDAAAEDDAAEPQLLEQQLQQLSDAAAVLLRQHGVTSPKQSVPKQSAQTAQQQQLAEESSLYGQLEQLQVIQAVQQSTAAVAPAQKQQQQQQLGQDEELNAVNLQKEQLLQLLLQQMIDTAGAMQRAAAAGACALPDASKGQLQGRSQLEQRLKRLSDAAAALLLGSWGPGDA